MIFFLPVNLLTKIGIDYRLVQTLYILPGIFLIVQYSTKILQKKWFVPLLSLVAIISIYKLIVDKGEGARSAVIQLVGAPILFAAFSIMLRDNIITRFFLPTWRFIAKYLFYWFLTITCLAIFERILGRPVLGWIAGPNESIVNISFSEFRSCSLLGHPLYNALVVSILMSFILISNFRTKIKFILWGIGFTSILCFNTRSSIVGNALLMGVFIFHSIFFNTTISYVMKKRIITYSIAASLLGTFLLFSVGLGGRLLEMGLFDEGSAQVRVDTWSIFKYITIKDVLSGMDYHDMNLIMYKAGLYTTENYWIDQLFSFGLILMVPYVILYFLLCKNNYKGYSLFHALFSTSTFLLISSTNNSLSADFLALFIFLLCIIIFHPKNFIRIVPLKYITLNKNKSKQI